MLASLVDQLLFTEQARAGFSKLYSLVSLQPIPRMHVV